MHQGFESRFAPARISWYIENSVPEISFWLKYRSLPTNTSIRLFFNFVLFLNKCKFYAKLIDMKNSNSNIVLIPPIHTVPIEN